MVVSIFSVTGCLRLSFMIIFVRLDRKSPPQLTAGKHIVSICYEDLPQGKKLGMRVHARLVTSKCGNVLRNFARFPNPFD